jgi:hypothetical protein
MHFFSSLTLLPLWFPLLVPFPPVSQLIYDRSIRVPSQEQPSCWRVATSHALRAVYTCFYPTAVASRKTLRNSYGTDYSSCWVIDRHHTNLICDRLISADHAALDFVRPGEGTMPPDIQVRVAQNIRTSASAIESRLAEL